MWSARVSATVGPWERTRSLASWTSKWRPLDDVESETSFLPGVTPSPVPGGLNPGGY